MTITDVSILASIILSVVAVLTLGINQMAIRTPHIVFRVQIVKPELANNRIRNSSVVLVVQNIGPGIASNVLLSTNSDFVTRGIFLRPLRHIYPFGSTIPYMAPGQEFQIPLMNVLGDTHLEDDVIPIEVQYGIDGWSIWRKHRKATIRPAILNGTIDPVA